MALLKIADANEGIYVTDAIIAEFVDARESRRKIIQSLRGIGKSSITSFYVPYYLFEYPNESITVASASEGKAVEFSTFVMELIKTWPLLYPLIPPKGSSRKSV